MKKIVIEHASELFKNESPAFYAGCHQWINGYRDYSDIYNLQGDSRRGYYAVSAIYEDVAEIIMFRKLPDEEKRHYTRCNKCNRFFDMRDFGQVARHEHKGLKVEPKPSIRL